MRTLKHLMTALIALAGLLILGFALFLALLPGPRPIPAEAQGLAVLTGGKGRVDYGLAALQQSLGIPVLITGVHPEATLADILQGRTLSDEQLLRLTLDHTALTTRDNVLVIKAWAAQHGITHVGLITSDYHQPRSYVLFKLLAPELAISPIPVQTQVPTDFLLREYGKLLAAPFLS
ncbi:MAG: YdcF family protein [Alphaproteobacteria bacterium]